MTSKESKQTLHNTLRSKLEQKKRRIEVAEAKRDLEGRGEF